MFLISLLAILFNLNLKRMRNFTLIAILIICVSSASIKTISSCTIIITQPAFAMYHHPVILTAAVIRNAHRLLFTTGIIILYVQMKGMPSPFVLITKDN